MLHRTIERIYVGDKYGDIARGIFIVRGENVALCGEIVSFELFWTKFFVLLSLLRFLGSLKESNRLLLSFQNRTKANRTTKPRICKKCL